MILRSIFSHRETHVQLLQKIRTLTDAPEGETIIKSRGVTGQAVA